MIRNAVIHLDGSLPVVADLHALPQPSDVSLLCTNMRTTDGKRPTFIDHSESWFVVPLAVVRFVEMPSNAMATAQPGSPTTAETEPGTSAIALPAPDDDIDLEPDEALLQRIRDI